MSWLTLQEYSIQTGISVSTLRRKIKNREFLNCKISNGRYLLKLNKKQALIDPKPLKTNSSFKQELQKKYTELKFLKRDYEDLLSLVHLLETEKRDLLKYIVENARYDGHDSVEL